MARRRSPRRPPASASAAAPPASETVSGHAAPDAPASASSLTVPAALPGPPLRPGWLAFGVLALVLASLAFGVWGLWRGMGASRPVDVEDTLGRLRQQVATLGRSDQISREANRKLQVALAERDEQIAALRADVAFYERFVGPAAQRRGVSVHALSLKAQDGRTWHFVATLVQNIERESTTTGRLSVIVEGHRNGRMVQLPAQPAAGIAFEFRFFQRVEGDLLLPEGFQPVRAIVTVRPQGMGTVQRSVVWSEAIGTAVP